MENQHAHHSAELDKCLAPADPKERKRWQNRMAQRTYRLNQKKRLRALTEAVSRTTTKEVVAGSKSPTPSLVAGNCTVDAASLATPSTTMSGSTPNASEEPWSILAFEGPQFQASPAYGADMPGLMDIAWAEPAMTGNIATQARPVLHRAVESGNASICRLLLSRGASVGTLDLSGKTALHVAVESGNEEIVQTMLQDQDSNVRDTWGRTALFPAVENKDVLVVKLLIEYGVGVNLRDSKGETPLHVAVEGGCEAMVQLLLENGADLSI